MRFVRFTLTVLGLVCASVGCMAAPQQVSSSSTAMQSAATGNPAPPQIAELRILWTSYLQTKQLAKLTSLYSRDAMFLDSTGQRIIGQQNIGTLLHNVTTAFNVSINLFNLMTEMSGDLAYESGNYQETLTQTATGAPESIHGTYIMLFKRQADGTWKILEQMWTQAPTVANQKQ